MNEGKEYLEYYLFSSVLSLVPRLPYLLPKSDLSWVYFINCGGVFYQLQVNVVFLIALKHVLQWWSKIELMDRKPTSHGKLFFRAKSRPRPISQFRCQQLTENI